MFGRLVLLLIAGAMLAACARPAPAPPERSVELRDCDDGGDGGVVIDGVCL